MSTHNINKKNDTFGKKKKKSILSRVLYNNLVLFFGTSLLFLQQNISMGYSFRIITMRHRLRRNP